MLKDCEGKIFREFSELTEEGQNKVIENEYDILNDEEYCDFVMRFLQEIVMDETAKAGVGIQWGDIQISCEGHPYPGCRSMGKDDYRFVSAEIYIGADFLRSIIPQVNDNDMREELYDFALMLQDKGPFTCEIWAEDNDKYSFVWGDERQFGMMCGADNTLRVGVFQVSNEVQSLINGTISKIFIDVVCDIIENLASKAKQDEGYKSLERDFLEDYFRKNEIVFDKNLREHEISALEM